ncbi:glycosyltransferase family 4 protein [Paenisporosarcina indica]|uniref:glycosyltransferase family 4 protein n=1 Tax=Paenisporosarcina indica TaxID=650093 RepID=UPI00094FE7A5|nr:glycosyltransferase family 4 protein [Paenisporosarcina indica]
MTILHLISGGETGGSKNHLITLLQQFSKEEVVLGVLQEGQLSNEARKAGIQTVVFNQTSRYDFSFLKKLSSFIQKNHIHIVHTHGPRANFFTYLLKNFVMFRWFTTIHSDPTKDFIKGGIKGKIFTSLNMRVIKKIDHFFAVSHRFGEMLEGFGIKSDKISIIYNGISFAEPVGLPVTREQLGLNKDAFVVTMVARYHPIKNHPLAFDAVNKLRDEGIPIQLYAIGDGPERNHLEKLSDDRDYIHLAGFRQDIHECLKVSDSLLLTSDSESFPLVLLEAARAKIPVVTTDVGGVSALLPSQEFGYIAPTGDVEKVANYLRKLYESKLSGDIESMGEKLYQHAKHNFSLEQLEQATRNAYRKFS